MLEREDSSWRRPKTVKRDRRGVMTHRPGEARSTRLAGIDRGDRGAGGGSSNKLEEFVPPPISRCYCRTTRLPTL